MVVHPGGGFYTSISPFFLLGEMTKRQASFFVSVCSRDSSSLFCLIKSVALKVWKWAVHPDRSCTLTLVYGGDYRMPPLSATMQAAIHMAYDKAGARADAASSPLV